MTSTTHRCAPYGVVSLRKENIANLGSFYLSLVVIVELEEIQVRRQQIVIRRNFSLIERHRHKSARLSYIVNTLMKQLLAKVSTKKNLNYIKMMLFFNGEILPNFSMITSNSVSMITLNFYSPVS